VTPAWNKIKNLIFVLCALPAIAQDTRPPTIIADPPPPPPRVVDKKPVDSTHWAILTETEGFRAGQLDLDILDVSKAYGPFQQLENESENSLGELPTLEIIDAHSAYVHFYSDYGFYQRSLKYLFDLGGEKPPAKIRYGILALTSVMQSDGKLYYSASYNPLEPPPQGWHARQVTIAIQPRDDATPNYEITDVPVPSIPTTVLPEHVHVENVTPPGQQHRPSTILVGDQSYPAPIPTLHFYRLTLPDKQPPAEIESDIGPYVERDGKIWFATTFYDGEGTSGIGAIGSFEIASRRYEMQYLPEIVHWSASTMILDGDDLWIGLKQRPEGAEIGRGLLRYNIATGTAQLFPIPDVIFTLGFAGDALYCGTSHGLYMLRADHLAQLRFEPDVTGRLIMIPRPIGK
jgi:hypothetical protein